MSRTERQLEKHWSWKKIPIVNLLLLLEPSVHSGFVLMFCCSVSSCLSSDPSMWDVLFGFNSPYSPKMRKNPVLPHASHCSSNHLSSKGTKLSHLLSSLPHSREGRPDKWSHAILGEKFKMILKYLGLVLSGSYTPVHVSNYGRSIVKNHQNLGF